MQQPNRILLRQGWRFALCGDEHAVTQEYDDSAFEQISVPHDWQIGNARDARMEMGWSQGYRPRNQVGVYRLRFDADRAWQGRCVRLLFEGCQRFYSVYLNGQKVAEKRYGYVPFLCDITRDIRMGEQNLLCVRVNNADTQGDRWYSGAGLYRDVQLLIQDQTHIVPDGVACRTQIAGEDAQAQVCVRLNAGQEAARVRLDAVLKAPDGAMAAQAQEEVTLAPGGGEVTLLLPVKDVVRWDMDNPALYTLSLTLLRDGREVDWAQETIGFRTALFDGEQGFVLNGRVRKLYGANLHHDGGLCFGAAVPEGVLRRRLTRLKEIGCNAIRCSHNPHARELYDLCDEMGLVVIDEVYDKWCNSDLYFGKLFEEDCLEDLRAMVHRDQNHPCVILWSLGNELEIQYTDLFYQHLTRLRDACRALDATRPVSLALIGFCTKDYDDRAPLTRKLDAALRYAQIVDVFMGNYMECYYKALRDAGMNKAIIGSEVFSYYRTADLSSVNTMAVSPWRDVEENPYVAGGFVWAGVDYLGEAGAYPSLGWTGCPIDSAGFAKLRASHLKSQWCAEPMVKIGVYDENDPWDMATANWSFPQMSGHWSFRQPGRMMHVAVMSNSQQVRLYLNDEPVRTASPDTPDRMAHFYVPFRPGKLRAVSVTQGRVVAEETLLTAKGPDAIRLTCTEVAGAPGHEVAHVEAELLDEHGQPCTWESPQVTFAAEGGAELLAVDNGNFVGDRNVHSGSCAFHLGHALAYIRPNGRGKAGSVSAVCGKLHARIEVAVKP